MSQVTHLEICIKTLSRTRNLRRKEADKKKSEFVKESVKEKAVEHNQQQEATSGGSKDEGGKEVVKEVVKEVSSSKPEVKKKVYTKDTSSADGEAGSSFLNPAEVARQERLRKQREQKVDSQELLRNFLSVFIFRQSFSRILPPRGSRRRRRLWLAWWWRTGRKCGRVFLRSQTRQT